MRWLIIQSAGEHDGSDKQGRNDYLRECFAWEYALKNNGINVDIWGKRHKNFNTEIDFESYDVILIAEQYEFGWLPDLSKIIKPLKIQWIVDAHINTNMYLNTMEKCDIILHATREILPYYYNLLFHKKHLWLPNMVDDRYFKVSEDYDDKFGAVINDIIFVGGVSPSRANYINNLRKDEIDIKTFTITGEEMLRLIYTSKIHFNKSSGIDLPYRVFETIGLGTCLVTNNDPCLSYLGFIDGKNCLLYNDYYECRKKISEALENGEWGVIGVMGNSLSKQHTYTHRVRELLKEI